MSLTFNNQNSRTSATIHVLQKLFYMKNSCGNNIKPIHDIQQISSKINEALLVSTHNLAFIATRA
jgi:hypothetical protein